MSYFLAIIVVVVCKKICIAGNISEVLHARARIRGKSASIIILPSTFPSKQSIEKLNVRVNMKGSVLCWRRKEKKRLKGKRCAVV